MVKNASHLFQNSLVAGDHYSFEQHAACSGFQMQCSSVWDNAYKKCSYCDSSCDSCSGFKEDCDSCTGGYHKGRNSCHFTCSVKSNYLDFNKVSCEDCSSTCTTGCIESPINCNNCPNGTYYRPTITNVTQIAQLMEDTI